MGSSRLAVHPVPSRSFRDDGSLALTILHRLFGTTNYLIVTTGIAYSSELMDVVELAGIINELKS